ncbi:hypothetical protein HF086_003940 [Spodoptera exigua]|uniref:Uncharacterized protein n=1 Tax=Spodoptera exigua TaxID=7107 RepID=A0A922MB35_SPOEX|nr:hypothetical protein HF086_003940 [Spodoptera exigua]
MRAMDKRNMSRLPTEQRARLQELRSRKEVGHFLMPDAPPSKNRSSCTVPFGSGHPRSAAPRIPQNWELQKSDEFLNFSPGPSTSSTGPELSINEDDPEEEILQCEHSAVLNPGSDVEEEEEEEEEGGGLPASYPKEARC